MGIPVLLPLPPPDNPANESGMLPRDFYARPTVTVARELLGKVLTVREPARSPAGWRSFSGRIVETEAYHGTDPASHSARGQTPRNRVMFGEPGRAYVYFIYGNHEMLNFVTEEPGYPGAVLIRALEPLAALSPLSDDPSAALMARRRGGLPRAQWTNGPGKLCAALGIRMSDNGQPLTGPRLTVHDDGFRTDGVLRSPRVGISSGQDKLWRFFLKDHPFVSKAPQNREAR